MVGGGWVGGRVGWGMGVGGREVGGDAGGGGGGGGNVQSFACSASGNGISPIPFLLPLHGQTLV